MAVLILSFQVALIVGMVLLAISTMVRQAITHTQFGTVGLAIFACVCGNLLIAADPLLLAGEVSSMQTVFLGSMVCAALAMSLTAVSSVHLLCNGADASRDFWAD